MDRSSTNRIASSPSYKFVVKTHRIKNNSRINSREEPANSTIIFQFLNRPQKGHPQRPLPFKAEILANNRPQTDALQTQNGLIMFFCFDYC